MAALLLCGLTGQGLAWSEFGMKDEPEERLITIRDQLEKTESKDFWEIIDRGRNFEFMPPKQRACMAQFFEWLKIK